MKLFKDTEDKDLLQPFIDFYSKNNRAVKVKEITKENGFPFSYSPYQKKFGGLYKISLLCDYTANIVLSSGFSDKELLKPFISFYNKNNRPVKNIEINKYNGFDFEYQLYLDRFGGLQEISELCDYSPNRTISNRFTQEEILKPFIIFYEKHNRSVKNYEITKENGFFYCYTLYINKYTSLENIAKLCGYEADFKYKWRKAEILAKISNEINNGIMLNVKKINKLSKGNKNFPCIKTIHNNFGTLKNVAKILGIKYIGDDYQVSEGEIELFNYIDEKYNVNITKSDRTVLIYDKTNFNKNKEIDILLPELKIGIEYNGDYTHSIEHKDETYHTDKTRIAKDYGYMLIHIFESEWKNNRKEIENYLDIVFNSKNTKAIGKIGSFIEIDNMKPIKYTNVEFIKTTNPKLVMRDRHESWDCGISTYKIIGENKDEKS